MGLAAIPIIWYLVLLFFWCYSNHVLDRPPKLVTDGFEMAFFSAHSEGGMEPLFKVKCVVNKIPLFSTDSSCLDHDRPLFRKDSAVGVVSQLVAWVPCHHNSVWLCCFQWEYRTVIFFWTFLSVGWFFYFFASCLSGDGPGLVASLLSHCRKPIIITRHVNPVRLYLDVRTEIWEWSFFLTAVRMYGIWYLIKYLCLLEKLHRMLPTQH